MSTAAERLAQALIADSIAHHTTIEEVYSERLADALHEMADGDTSLRDLPGGVVHFWGVDDEIPFPDWHIKLIKRSRR